MGLQQEGTHWTKLVIDGLVEHWRKTIVNLSSRLADHVLLLLIDYGAAKMFFERLLESLDAKCRGRAEDAVPGVVICCRQAGGDEGERHSHSANGEGVCRNGDGGGWDAGRVVQQVSAHGDMLSALWRRSHFHFSADYDYHDIYCIIELTFSLFLSLQISQVALTPLLLISLSGAQLII